MDNKLTIAVTQWMAQAAVNEPATLRRMVGANELEAAAALLLQESRITPDGVPGDSVATVLQRAILKSCSSNSQASEWVVRVVTSIPVDRPSEFEIRIIYREHVMRYLWHRQCMMCAMFDGTETTHPVTPEDSPFAIAMRHIRSLRSKGC